MSKSVFEIRLDGQQRLKLFAIPLLIKVGVLHISAIKANFNK
jgi:hypothetical protein